MKKLFPLIVLGLLLSCKTSVKKESKTLIITSNQIKEIITYLASEETEGRRAGTVGIDHAATFIENKFKSYNLNPYFATYRDNFKIDSIDAFNVVGFLPGTDEKLKNEVIILGAHYDHIGVGKSIKRFGGKLVPNDSLANGANDNASGTSAVITMANYFATKKNNKRSIMFALFSGEEWGLFGSKHLAKKLKDANVDVYAMINFEMIGVPLKDRDYQFFVSGFDRSNMANKINEYSQSNLAGFSEVSKKYQLFKRSDNYPFYNEFKAPCQSVSSCDLTNYDYYHHVSDEAQLMDYEFMAKLINSTIPAIEKMSQTPTKEIVMYEN